MDNQFNNTKLELYEYAIDIFRNREYEKYVQILLDPNRYNYAFLSDNIDNAKARLFNLIKAKNAKYPSMQQIK